MNKLLIPIALLFVIGAGCSKPSQSAPPVMNKTVNSSVQTSTAQETSLDVSTWQTYTDPTSGFRFQYPANWNILSANKSYTVCLSEVSTGQSCDIGVNVVKAPDESHPSGVVSNEDLIKVFEKKYSSQKITKDQKVIHGLHTLQYSVPDETQIFIETSTYDYVFSIFQHDALGNVRNNYSLIDQVLSRMMTTVNVAKK